MSNSGKQAPLYQRLRKYFDIKPTFTKTKVEAAVKPKKVDDDIVEVPVTLGFNWNDDPIGRVVLTKKAADLLAAGSVLSPAYEPDDKKLIGLGLIPAANAVPPKEADEEAEKTPQPDPRYSGFLWHLFLIAIMAGLLTIIALIIRLFYIKN